MADKQEQNEIQTAIRIPKSWLDEFDQLAEQMSEPGMNVSRADVHRLAIRRGLAVLGKEVKKR